MNGFNDLYGSDQVSVNPTLPYPSLDYKNSSPGRSHMGAYEDQLRFQQFGMPARLRCDDRNPYIQDSIEKSQRHAPIRIGSVQDRMPFVAMSGCNPSLAAMYNGVPCGVNGNQGIQYSTNGECKPTVNVSDCPKANANTTDDDSKKKSLDANTLMYIFVFIVLIFMCLHFWKSVSDLKTATEGGFQNLRDLMAISRG